MSFSSSSSERRGLIVIIAAIFLIVSYTLYRKHSVTYNSTDVEFLNDTTARSEMSNHPDSVVSEHMEKETAFDTVTGKRKPVSRGINRDKQRKKAPTKSREKKYYPPRSPLDEPIN